jgi:hypothetical protein
MNLSRKIFLSFLVFSSLQVTAQKLKVTAAVSKNSILLGEPFELNVKAEYPANSKKPFRLDSIPHFEFIGTPAIDSTSSNNIVTLIGRYQLTSFDSGHWVIMDTIGMDVIFSDFNPDQDYHDIKSIIEVAPPKKKQWWWWAAGGAVIVAAIIIYLLKRKKPEKKAPPAPVIAVDPYEDAMKQLEKLQNSKMDPKSWHSALTDIFRQYVFRKKGIFSLQKTTDDLVLQLKQLSFNKGSLDALSQSLRLSDFVKFAKYMPTEADNKATFDVIRDTIMLIEKWSTTG